MKKLFITAYILLGTLLFSQTIYTNKLGINTTHIPEGYILAINGEMITEGIRISQFENWPDYVFEKNYYLKDLLTLEKEIKQLGHLPKIPSKKEVLDNGIDIGNMNVLLLEKIEELTLYIIKQNKRIKNLKEKIDNPCINKNKS